MKHRVTLYVTILIAMSAKLFLLLEVYLWEFNSLYFVLAFLVGMQDAFLNNFVAVVCGFEFESKLLPFSLNKMVSAVSAFMLIMISSTLKSRMSFGIYYSLMMLFEIFAIVLMLGF